MAETDFPPHEDLTQGVTGSFTASARVLFSAGTVADTLGPVVGLAVETIDGCDYAGIFLLEGETVTTPVHTDPMVIEVDALQHRYRQGPCLDAVAGDSSLYADDLADDARWPLYAPAATEAGVRSVLALSL